MKKSTFLFLSLFIAFTAFSQNYHQQDQFIFDGTPDDRFFDPFQSPTQRQGVLKNATKAMDNVVSRPDSTVKYDFDSKGDSIALDKTIYQYDAFGNISSFASYKWDEAEHRWLKNRKYLYSYNNNNVYISFKSFKGESEEWEFSSSSDYEYNSDKIVRGLSKRLDSNRDTIFDESIYTYDSNPTIDTRYIYTWTKDTTTKELTSKYINNYDINGNDSIYYIERYKSGLIVYGSKSEYFFDDNKKVKKLNSLWDSNSNGFIYDRKIDFEYEHLDENFEKIVEHIYSWNTEKMDWDFSYINESEYNSSGNIISSSTLNYDNDSNLKYTSLKNETNYNDFNDRISYINYSWDTLTVDWIPIRKTEYNRSNEGIMHSETITNWKTTEMIWDDKAYMTYYYYNGWLLSVNESNISNIKIYPNPATNFISVVNPMPGKKIDIELLSLSGQQVNRIHTNNILSQINIEKLTPGIYFLRLKYDGKNEIHKVIKK